MTPVSTTVPAPAPHQRVDAYLGFVAYRYAAAATNSLRACEPHQREGTTCNVSLAWRSCGIRLDRTENSSCGVDCCCKWGERAMLTHPPACVILIALLALLSSGNDAASR